MLGDQCIIQVLDSVSSSSSAPDSTLSRELPSVSRNCVIGSLQVAQAQKGGHVEGLVNCCHSKKKKKNRTGSGLWDSATKSWPSGMG